MRPAGTAVGRLGASATAVAAPSRAAIARYALGTAALLSSTTLLGLLLWTLVPAVALGSTPHAITSGSMAPLIERGDVVLTTPPSAGQRLEPPAVVAFTDARHGDHVVHRIVDTDPGGTLITRGDANAVPDATPLDPDRVTGVGHLVVPAIGLPSAWLDEGRRGLAVAVLAGAVLLLWAARFGLLDRYDPWLAPSAHHRRDRPRDRRRRRGGSRGRTASAGATTAFLLLVVLVGTAAGAFTAQAPAEASWATGAWGETVDLYLQAQGEGDQATAILLPMGEDEPTQTSLPNYSTDRDDGPGRLTAVGGEQFDLEAARTQYWVMPAGDDDLVVHGEATLALWAAIRGERSTEEAGELRAWVYDCDQQLDCDVLADAEVADDPWGTAPGFVEHRLELGFLRHTVEAGRVLIVQVVVGAATGDDMWLAYDTIDHPSRLEIQEPPPPATPEDLTVTGTSSSTVEVSWAPVDDADSYRLRHREPGADTWTEAAPTDGTTATVAGLSPETTYELQVRADDHGVAGDWSETVTATTTSASPERLFLRSTRTNPGTGGTVFDLDRDQGGDVTAIDVQGNGWSEMARFQAPLEQVPVTDDLDLSVHIAARGGSTQLRLRVARLDGSGAVVASSAPTAAFGSAGTHAAAVSLPADWEAGDMIAVIVESNHAGGGGRALEIATGHPGSWIEFDH